jgi:membrane-bound metal-dependent hydrolase YbcI (DUF457 family)
MMGRSHALSGWCVGLAAAPLVGLNSIAEIVPFAATTAGYALLPDLDHPRATASRLLGPLTWLISRVVRATSAALYAATKGPRDEDCTGQHRHASHTLAAAILFGGLAAGAGTWSGGWAVLTVALVGLILAVNVLGDWLLIVVVAAGLWWTVDNSINSIPDVTVQAGLDQIGSWIGAAVAVGMFVHCLGDSLTRSGCPWLWPIPIRGETWYEIRLPRLLRFRTGGRVEQLLVVPALAVAAVLLLPGAGPVVHDLLT